MSTFFVLPPRECLEFAVADFVARVLPGLSAPPAVADALLAALEFEANRDDDAYFVHREELAGSGDTAADLMNGFGAAPGDQVVDIGFTGNSRPATARRGVLIARMSGEAVTR